MWLERKRFLFETEVGRRAAERAAEEARRSAAATAIQKHVRRRAAQRKVCGRWGPLGNMPCGVVFVIGLTVHLVLLGIGVWCEDLVAKSRRLLCRLLLQMKLKGCQVN